MVCLVSGNYVSNNNVVFLFFAVKRRNVDRGYKENRNNVTACMHAQQYKYKNKCHFEYAVSVNNYPVKAWGSQAHMFPQRQNI